MLPASSIFQYATNPVREGLEPAGAEPIRHNAARLADRIIPGGTQVAMHFACSRSVFGSQATSHRFAISQRMASFTAGIMPTGMQDRMQLACATSV